MHRIILSVVLVSFLVVPVTALAHEDVESYEAGAGEYTVDVGYSTDAPSADTAVQFDFKLRKDAESISFSDVWVRIVAEDGTTVLSTGLHNAQFGGPRLNYRFPGPGRYTISFRFEKGATILAEGAFPMNVSMSEVEGTPLRTRVFDLFLVAVIACCFLWHRRKIR
jgi:hypothetical protein